MTDYQMLNEIIERRRQWGETRDSDFDWLVKKVKELKEDVEFLKRQRRQIEHYDDY